MAQLPTLVQDTRPSLTHWLEEALVAMPSQGRLATKAPQDLAFGFTDDRKIEKGNQDRFVIAYCLDQNFLGGPWFFAGICDGVGGELNGEIAASIAMAEILSELCTSQHDLPSERMKGAIVRAHEAIRQRLRGSATTFAGVLLSASGTFTTGSVGDSRIYSLSQSGVQKISEDDTLEDMLRRQVSHLDEAKLHEALRNLKQHWKDSLGQAIGSNLPLDPQTRSWPYIDNDNDKGCLLCTDGIWKTVEPVLEHAVRASGNRQDLARRLISLTETLSANDNATGVVIPNVDNVLDWLRIKHSRAENGLVHIVLPTESIVAPWSFFDRGTLTPSLLGQSNQGAVSFEQGAQVKTKSKTKTKAKRNPKNLRPSAAEIGDQRVQLTIEEEIRDDNTTPTGPVQQEHKSVR